jgi:hypothetical protein
MSRVRAQGGRRAGLDSLNRKVLAAPANEVLDLIAEHNMAAMLVRREFAYLQHEPPSMSKPVTFLACVTAGPIASR